MKDTYNGFAYPLRYSHGVELFKRTTAEQRVYLFEHLVRPLQAAFAQLDDVAAGTAACQLYPGISLDPRRLANALAMANQFLLDTHRIEPGHEGAAALKLAEIMRVFIPGWLHRWPAVQLTMH